MEEEEQKEQQQPKLEEQQQSPGSSKSAEEEPEQQQSPGTKQKFLENWATESQRSGERVRNGNDLAADDGEEGGAALLKVTGLSGPGEAVSARDLFFVMALNARDDEEEQQEIISEECCRHVLDIYYPPDANFALVKLDTAEGAQRAKAALDQSWLFDKWIRVWWCASADQRIFAQAAREAGPTPFADRMRNEGTRSWNEELFLYNAQMPSKKTRFLQAGNISDAASRPNLAYLRKWKDQEEPQVPERQADREDRPQPSPVLYVTGMERAGDRRILTRTDLIHLFSMFGTVVDIDIGMFQGPEPDKYDNNNYTMHRALVQMQTDKEATRAMHAMDHSWQMGRFLEITYSDRTEIRWTNDDIMLARESKYLAERAMRDRTQVLELLQHVRAERRAGARVPLYQKPPVVDTANHNYDDEQQVDGGPNITGGDDIGVQTSSSRGSQTSSASPTTSFAASTVIAATSTSPSTVGADPPDVEEEEDEVVSDSEADAQAAEDSCNDDEECYSSCSEGALRECCECE